MAAWPPRPVILISKRSVPAITGPAMIANLPAGNPGQLCKPNTRSIGKRVNSPSSTITRPPPSCSSAGWKMK